MRPNFLLFTVDEQRYPTIYESDQLRLWKKENLKFQTMLEKKSVSFHNHYINTSACTPSRASFHTGQYSNVTGVTQTTGAAKQPQDPGFPWLKPFSVPTIGNYFEEAGYKTFLKGKWHVTDADIRLPGGEPLLTFDKDGKRLKSAEKFYLEKDVLSDFGYHGWIGPDPHGEMPQLSASSVPAPETGRDLAISQQVIETIQSLKSHESWLMFASMVDPHDITAFGNWAQRSDAWKFHIDDTLPKTLFTADFYHSIKDDLSTKPYAQTDYRNNYHSIFQPITDVDSYWRLYYSLQRKVDERMMEIYQALQRSCHRDNTIVVLFSDHGDFLSSHGGLHQKWFAAYEEAIKVPFMISHKSIEPRRVEDLTSHIDLLPTLLSLAGLDAESIRSRLSNKFSLALQLPGRNLLIPRCSKQTSSSCHSCVSSGSSRWSRSASGSRWIKESRDVYFNTTDNISEGPHQVNVAGQPYKAVQEPCKLEAVISLIDGKKYKLTRYYGQTGKYNGLLNELYCVTDDPMELDNLFNKRCVAKIQDVLTEKLNALSFNNRAG